jgi:hypothetical protein
MQCPEKTRKQAAVGFVVFSLLTVGMLFVPLWQPRADFDVTATLWIMQNVVPLILTSGCFALATGAGITWLRCKRRDSTTK